MRNLVMKNTQHIIKKKKNTFIAYIQIQSTFVLLLDILYMSAANCICVIG